MLYKMRLKNAKSNRPSGQTELDLLAQIRDRSRTAKGANGRLSLGIGDDCALLRPKPGEELAVTTDLSIAGRHFLLEIHPPKAVGHRTLARGLSDLAAMGARPVAAFLSLGLPRELTIAKGRRKAWIDGFLDGFLGLAKAYSTPLAGGDLAESPIAVADIILVGAVPQGKALLRSGSRPGEVLCVTGSLGGAAAGLQGLVGADGLPSGLKSKKVQELLAPHFYPQPRIAQGRWLQRKELATSAIDLSDGLSTDLAHICAASGVGAEVIAGALPIYPKATMDQALDGGEDYELLFTVAPDARLPKHIAGLAITRIGRIVPASKHRTPVTLISTDGSRPLEPKGWEHFS